MTAPIFKHRRSFPMWSSCVSGRCAELCYVSDRDMFLRDSTVLPYMVERSRLRDIRMYWKHFGQETRLQSCWRDHIAGPTEIHDDLPSGRYRFDHTRADAVF